MSHDDRMHDPSKALGLPAENVDELLAKTEYRVVGRLGGGRTADVYKVRHRILGRQFVLKVLRSHLASDPVFADRLRREAQAAARIRHENVVEVVDLWTSANGNPCVIMELLEGRTIGQELEIKDRLPPMEAIGMTREALAGLGAAHAQGVIHRDITPENLFLHAARGFPRRLKILDFGLARVLPTSSLRPLDPLSVPTRAGAMVGSPRFMSPEGTRGEPVDQRADLFSLGVVLYVMLTGRGPHDTPAARVAPPSHYGGMGISPELDSVVLRAIADKAAERYQTAADFSADLEALE